MTEEQLRKIRWLNRAFHADKAARALEEKRKIDAGIAERISRGLGSTGGGTSGNSTENALIRLADTEREVQERLKELAVIREEISQAIKQVEDLDAQTILVWHFLNYKSFDDIAGSMHYSRPTVMRKYKKAIEKMILNDTP